MRKPRPSRLTDRHLAAPIGGVNTADAISELPLSDATQLINHINGESGLAVRPGYKDHAIGMDGEVRSVIGYTGASAAGGSDKMFACTGTKIYDITAGGPAPATAYTFLTQDANTGYGSSLIMVTGGGRFLVYTDESNGYLIRPDGGAWAKVNEGAGAGEISNVNPGSLVNVVSFKGRLMFVEKNSTRMWYLAPGAVYGAATAFDFGREFPHGGHLAQLAVYTRDGGAGADDILVAISSAGDVVVYAGTDPATLGAFQRTGGWFVGGVPAGRRLASAFGGELMILTVSGALPLSRMVAGRTLLSPDQYATYKIQFPFTATMADRRSAKGWSILPHPKCAAMLITVPKVAGETSKQFAMSIAKGAWHFWRDLPIFSGEVWNGKFYFGTADGRVCVSEGFVDNVAHDGSIANAKEIVFSGFSAFRSLQTAKLKQVQMINPVVLGQLKPNIQAQARYDFDISDITTIDPSAESGIPNPAADTDVWGDAQWADSEADEAGGVWDGTGGSEATDALIGYVLKKGQVGMGNHVAVAWRGQSGTKLTLVGFDILIEVGGYLR